MRYENGWIFADGRFVRGGFSVENGRFAHVLEDVPGPAEDLDGALVIPGLVDIHVHGCAGADFSDGDYAGLVRMARYLARRGVTSFAPASMTLPYDALDKAFHAAGGPCGRGPTDGHSDGGTVSLPGETRLPESGISASSGLGQVFAAV